MKVSVVIPAFNEVETIMGVVEKCARYADEVIVVDDGSWDGTGEASRKAGAKVIRHVVNMGVGEALKTGFRHAKGDIIVRVDGDGQHDPAYIPLLVRPVALGEADVVVGRRSNVPMVEALFSALAWLFLRVHDAGSGFIALRRELAQRLELRGEATCGTLLLEAALVGARISEVPVPVYPRTSGRRRLRVNYVKHTLAMLKLMKDGLSRRHRRMSRPGAPPPPTLTFLGGG